MSWTNAIPRLERTIADRQLAVDLSDDWSRQHQLEIRLAELEALRVRTGHVRSLKEVEQQMTEIRTRLGQARKTRNVQDRQPSSTSDPRRASLEILLMEGSEAAERQQRSEHTHRKLALLTEVQNWRPTGCHKTRHAASCDNCDRQPRTGARPGTIGSSTACHQPFRRRTSRNRRTRRRHCLQRTTHKLPSCVNKLDCSKLRHKGCSIGNFCRVRPWPELDCCSRSV